MSVKVKLTNDDGTITEKSFSDLIPVMNYACYLAMKNEKHILTKCGDVTISNLNIIEVSKAIMSFNKYRHNPKRKKAGSKSAKLLKKEIVATP